MKNIFNKSNGQAIKNSVIGVLQDTLGATHFVLQTASDSVAKLESQWCTADGENPEDVYVARYEKTVQKQRDIKSAYLQAKRKTQRLLDNMHPIKLSDNISEEEQLATQRECIRDTVQEVFPESKWNALQTSISQS